jgi:hypothetical protein
LLSDEQLWYAVANSDDGTSMGGDVVHITAAVEYAAQVYGGDDSLTHTVAPSLNHRRRGGRDGGDR